MSAVLPSKAKKLIGLFVCRLTILVFTINVSNGADNSKVDDDEFEEKHVAVSSSAASVSDIEIMPFSSEISGGKIGDNILSLLRSAQHRIIIASDKCTNKEFLDDLLVLRNSSGGSLEINIVTGEDKQTQKTLGQPKYADRPSYRSIPSNPDKSGKMHNKFMIVDEDLVITGSPNCTFAAYNYNIESFVAIRHKPMAELYYGYYQYIISGKDKDDDTQAEYQRVRHMMNDFNGTPNNPIQVCLAPISDIKTFIINELHPSHIIDINMFLISRASVPDNDIVDNLLRAGHEGARITIKVDGDQYDKFEYMKKALKPFKDDGQSDLHRFKKTRNNDDKNKSD